MKSSNSSVRLVLAVWSALALFCVSTAAQDFEEFRIGSDSDFERVEKALANSSAEEIVVSIAQGKYTLTDTFHINRSRVSIFGEGEVLLSLANGVNKPVIAIGSQKSYPLAGDAIQDIEIMYISVDGNKEEQSSELEADRPWIRNNGIDARMVKGLVLNHVTSNNNRSGGFVISWSCSDVRVVDCVFERNYFDGMAYYDSERVYSVDSISRNNLSAGISLDNNLRDCLFLRCTIEGNGDVGVFARNSKRLTFEKCTVSGSGDWAFFLAHDDDGHGIHDSVISNCRVVGNAGGVRMASINEEQSSGNVVVTTYFNDNEKHDRKNVDTCGSEIKEVVRTSIAARIQEMIGSSTL